LLKHRHSLRASSCVVSLTSFSALLFFHFCPDEGPIFIALEPTHAEVADVGAIKDQK
jgi:hypothetical protein